METEKVFKFRRRKAERPKEILDAARALTRDCPPPTMAAIARAAGVTKGTLYLYFPNKAALLAAAEVHRA